MSKQTSKIEHFDGCLLLFKSLIQILQNLSAEIKRVAGSPGCILHGTTWSLSREPWQLPLGVTRLSTQSLGGGVPAQGSSVFPPVNVASKCLVVTKLLLTPFYMGFYTHRHFMEDTSRRTADTVTGHSPQNCSAAVLSPAAADLSSQVTERRWDPGPGPSEGAPSNPTTDGVYLYPQTFKSPQSHQKKKITLLIKDIFFYEFLKVMASCAGL